MTRGRSRATLTANRKGNVSSFNNRDHTSAPAPAPAPAPAAPMPRRTTLPATTRASGLTGVAIPALSTTGTDVPGLRVVATESGTRYLLLVPPEGYLRVMRVASYGWSRNVWRPLVHGAYQTRGNSDEPRVPVEVGAGMYVDMGPSAHDYYRSTEVVSITSYPLPALLSVCEIEEYAHAAMRDSTIDLAAAAYAEGRIDDETVAAICAEQGFTLADVQERLHG